MKKTFIINGEEVDVDVRGPELFALNGVEYRFSATRHGHGGFTLHDGVRNHRGLIAGGRVFLPGAEIVIEEKQGGRLSGSTTPPDSPHTAPMPGTIRTVRVEAGDAVIKGQALMVMEAMKLQLTIAAAFDGTVKALRYKEGDLVEDGALLVEIEPR